MYKSKKFSYDYDEYETEGKSVETMGEDILNDEEFEELEELIVGDWGDSSKERIVSIEPSKP